MNAVHRSNATTLIAFVVISCAVVGYFTGLQAPMNVTTANSRPIKSEPRIATRVLPESGVIPATHYSEMHMATASRRSSAQLAGLKSAVDPLAEIRIHPNEKFVALQQRAQNRAYNGAPPTIPHAIEQRSDASCVACHKDGVSTASLRIPRMSHAFLANCTQCHVESNPRHMSPSVFRDNVFTGLPAPTAGPRAYPGAPPQIPHTTWMRSDCMSCHGYQGRHGIRTTHPWRHNCQQCHAPSASMEQTMLTAEPEFLPGPTIRK